MKHEGTCIREHPFQSSQINHWSFNSDSYTVKNADEVNNGITHNTGKDDKMENDLIPEQSDDDTIIITPRINKDC